MTPFTTRTPTKQSSGSLMAVLFHFLAFASTATKPANPWSSMVQVAVDGNATWIIADNCELCRAYPAPDADVKWMNFLRYKQVKGDEKCYAKGAECVNCMPENPEEYVLFHQNCAYAESKELIGLLEKQHGVKNAHTAIIGKKRVNNIAITDILTSDSILRQYPFGDKKDRLGEDITPQTQWIDLKLGQLREANEILFIRNYRWRPVDKKLVFDCRQETGEKQIWETTVEIPEFLSLFADFLKTEKAVNTPWIWRVEGGKNNHLLLRKALDDYGGWYWDFKEIEKDLKKQRPGDFEGGDLLQHHVTALFKEAVLKFKMQNKWEIPKNVWYESGITLEKSEEAADAQKAAKLFSKMKSTQQNLLLLIISLWLPVIDNKSHTHMGADQFSNLLYAVIYDEIIQDHAWGEIL